MSQRSPIDLTVVTIAKDNPSGLCSTLNSLEIQKSQAWRCLIVVPVSSTETLEVAKGRIIDNRFSLINDEARGIYEAMNLALLECNSKYVWFMNAGDEFFNNETLNQALAIADSVELDLLIGKHLVRTTWREQERIKEEERFTIKKVGAVGFALNRRSGCHQSMLFRTSRIKDIGGYSPRYRLASDFDLVLKLITLGKVFKTDQLFARIESGGIADKNLNVVFQEKHQVRIDLIRAPFIRPLSYIWTMLARLNLIIRQARWARM